MDIQRLKSLLIDLDDLDKANSRALDETKNELVKYASEKEVLVELLNILCNGSQRARRNVVDILSDVHTEQAFNLLIYALHDPHSLVRHQVIDNLERKEDLKDTLFWAEDYLANKQIDDKTAREEALRHIRYYKKFEKRRYFLPLIENYLNTNPDLDLTIRGNLLSVLVIHGILEETDNLIEIMKYGSFDGKLYATKKLIQTLDNETINDKTRRKILEAISEASQQEYLPDIVWLLDEALGSINKDKGALSIIRYSSDWIKEGVLYFRKLGFYQEDAKLSDDELVRKIRTACEYASDKFSHNTQLVTLLEEDKKRTLTDNREDFIQDYETILTKLGEMSCGSFTPKNIVQTQDKTKEIMHISFEYNEKEIQIQAYIYKNGVDIDVVETINDILVDKQIQFFYIKNTSCIVSLNSTQKFYLEKDLGLKFDGPGWHIPPHI